MEYPADYRALILSGPLERPTPAYFVSRRTPGLRFKTAPCCSASRFCPQSTRKTRAARIWAARASSRVARGSSVRARARVPGSPAAVWPPFERGSTSDYETRSAHLPRRPWGILGCCVKLLSF